tara:strand:- start:54 stop:233 length:180 start_codon:yes stop_codon:yes gene_type:complete
MVITDAKYIKLESEDSENHSVNATIYGQPMCIPMDTGNSYYAEILKQVANSTITIADAD